MLRRLHSLPGLVLALALTVTAISGVALSIQPALDHLRYPVISQGTSVAELASEVAARHQEIRSITVKDDGAVVATYADGAARGQEVVDPATGAGLGAYQTPAWLRAIIDLHRALLLGDAGRIATALSAGFMLVLTVSGTLLLVRRLGGWSHFFQPMRGSLSQRLHGELGRLAAIALMLSALTGLWMSATTFGLVSVDQMDPAVVTASGGAPAPIATLSALKEVDVARLRHIDFPARNDPTDVFTLTTTDGVATIDPATGQQLAFAPVTLIQQVEAAMRVLHTGRGAWALGLLLGLASTMVPLFSITGGMIWWKRTCASGKSGRKIPVTEAETIILVGSEGNSTWGFARTLEKALTQAGQKVHLGVMNDLSDRHLKARRMIILAATCGDGAAPASAARFMDRLGKLHGRIPVAVLGFGDRTFPHFCAFAHEVTRALDARGWPRLMDMKRVDRRSAQEFAQWSEDLGRVLGVPMRLSHAAERPRTVALELIERATYGEAIGTPIAILRFAAPRQARESRPLPRFEAGDLVGILPPDSEMPRFYSLASSARDGVLEICVRLRQGGLCSTFLHDLRPGERIDAFIRENPTFRPGAGRTPLILIGAGAGIGPLAGFVRANTERRPVHLYWGGRSPSSDFLYEHELAGHLATQRLTSLRTAFSRMEGNSAYVQDRLAADAHHLRHLIAQGAQILVCGGRDMSRAVTATLEAVIRPLGMDLATLKSNGQYVEDVY